MLQFPFVYCPGQPSIINAILSVFVLVDVYFFLIKRILFFWYFLGTFYFGVIYLYFSEFETCWTEFWRPLETSKPFLGVNPESWKIGVCGSKSGDGWYMFGFGRGTVGRCHIFYIFCSIFCAVVTCSFMTGAWKFLCFFVLFLLCLWSLITLSLITSA